MQQFQVILAGFLLITASRFIAQTPATILNFDGYDDYVEVPQVISGSFTMEYWMKTTMTGATGSGITAHWWSGTGIVDGECPSWQLDFGTAVYGNKLAFGIGGLSGADVTIFSTSNINTNNWVHVAVTWDQVTGQMHLYINGILEASSIGDTSPRTAPLYINLGRLLTGVNAYYNGSLDELKIWNTVRSASQISADRFCEINSSAQTPNLLSYYRFNQGIAGANNFNVSSLTDLSGNGNAGQLHGFALNGNTSNWLSGSPMMSSSVTISATNSVICEGSSVILTANGVGTYSWNVGSSNQTVNVTPSATTVYSVTLNPGSTCAAKGTFTVNVQNCTGLNELSEFSTSRIYPVPSSGSVYFEPVRAGLVYIISTNGAIVYSARVVEFQKLEIENLASGVYVMRFTGDDNSVSRQKFAIQR